MSEEILKQQIKAHYRQTEGVGSESEIRLLRQQAQNSGFSEEKINELFKEAFKEFLDEQKYRKHIVLEKQVSQTTQESSIETVQEKPIEIPKQQMEEVKNITEEKTPQKPPQIEPKAQEKPPSPKYLWIGMFFFALVLAMTVVFIYTKNKLIEKDIEKQTDQEIVSRKNSFQTKDLEANFLGEYNGEKIFLQIKNLDQDGNFSYKIFGRKNEFSGKVEAENKKISFFDLDKALRLPKKGKDFGVAQYRKQDDTIILRFENFELKH